MILPSKHIKLSESIIGLGGYLLKLLKEPITVDDLWFKFQKANNTDSFPAYHSFDNVVLGLNLLFSIGAIDIDEQGKIYYATVKAEC
jgi:hypothetical protein